MKKIRWQIIIILLTGLVVGILLIGQQPTIQPTAPKPTEGGIYTEGLIGNLSRLNPLFDLYNPVDRDVDRLIFSGLIRFDSKGMPVADLAESWGYSKDGTLYNISLRPNLKWHDGQPLTSDDVVFTIDLMRSESSYIPEDIRTFWKDVDVKALNDVTLQFRLPEPFSPFLDYLTFGILPKHIIGDMSVDDLVGSQFNLKPVGSGPYKLDYLIVEDNQIKGVVLSVFDDYYAKKPYIQQIVFRYYPDSASVMQAYKDGQVQGISKVTPDVLSEALNEPKLSIYTGRLPRMTLVLFNLNDPEVTFLQDANVRRALMEAINRQWIIDRIMGGQALIASGPILPDTWSYYDGIEAIPYDTDAAASLLKESGYTFPTVEGKDPNVLVDKDGQSLAFTMLYPDDETHAAVAKAIQDNWQKIGVKVDLEAVPYDQLIQDHLDQRSYQAALVDLNLARSPDPDPYPFWDQAQITGGQNYSQWDDRVASEYLEQARVTIDQTERTRLYRNFQVIFQKELPALPLYYPVYTYAVDQEVQGVQMGPLFDPSDRFATIQSWYLVAKRTVDQTSELPTATPNP